MKNRVSREYDDNGKLQCETIFNKGNRQTVKQWHGNGQFAYECFSLFYFLQILIYLSLFLL